MAKKRNDLEICANVLDVAREGAKKSHIVYQANLNFKVVNTYLGHLQEMGLISSSPSNVRLFKTTSKGLEYLNQYARLATTFNGARALIYWHSCDVSALNR